MGAWDASSFGNDAANDWAYSLQECSDLSCIEEALRRVLDAKDEYLEACVAEQAVAAAEVISWLRGWAGIMNPYTEKVGAWVKANPLRPSRTLIKVALAVLDRIQAPRSELAELWEGNKDWAAALNDLRDRLGRRFRKPDAMGKAAQSAAPREPRRRATIGDVFALPTPRGFALLQYVNHLPRYHQLIRVLPGLYPSIPADVGSIVEMKELYFLHFSIGAAARGGDVKFVGNFRIPEWAVDWPPMRAQQIRLDGKKPEWWAIVHGGEVAHGVPEDRRFRTLTMEQRKLSIAVWWSLPLLVDRIVEGWLPEHKY